MEGRAFKIGIAAAFANGPAVQPSAMTIRPKPRSGQLIFTLDVTNLFSRRLRKAGPRALTALRGFYFAWPDVILLLAICEGETTLL